MQLAKTSNYELRVFNKASKKTKVISFHSALSLEKVHDKVLKLLMNWENER
jgi:hypothetical protein